MVDFEAEVRGDSRRQSPVASFAGKAANVVGDMLELAELQAQLAKADTGAAIRRAIRPLAFLLLGSCGAIACFPVLVLGIASCVDAMTILNSWQSQLVVAGVGVLLASLTVWIAARRFLTSLRPFRRSADELAKNLEWIRSVIRSNRLPRT